MQIDLFIFWFDFYEIVFNIIYRLYYFLDLIF